MLANGERPKRLGLITRGRMHGLVRAGIVLWIFARVAFFTVLWLAVLLIAYLGYFTLPFIFVLAALALVSAISGWSFVRRIRARLSGR